MRDGRWWRVGMRVSMSAWMPTKARRLMLRRLGVRTNHTMFIANDVFIGSPRVVLEDGVGVNIGTILDGAGEIHVGEGVRIGIDCLVLSGTHDIEPDVIRRDARKPVVRRVTRIERGSWLCSRSVVQPGVTVAEGCVVLSGSVVAHDTLPNGLYGGVPARRISDLPLPNAEAEPRSAEIVQDKVSESVRKLAARPELAGHALASSRAGGRRGVPGVPNPVKQARR